MSKNGFKRGNGGNGGNTERKYCCICHLTIPLAEEIVDLPEGVAGKSCVEARKRLEQQKIPTEITAGESLSFAQ